MPTSFVFTAELEVSLLNRAFNDQSPANAVFHQQKVAAGSSPESWNAFALQFGAGYQHLTEAALAVKLLDNMGLPGDIGLQGALLSYIEYVGKANVGIVALQLGQILSGLEDASGELAVYSAAAAAWNSEITEAYVYSTNSANGTPSPIGPKSAGSAGWSSAMVVAVPGAAHSIDVPAPQLVGVATPTDAALGMSPV